MAFMNDGTPSTYSVIWYLSSGHSTSINRNLKCKHLHDSLMLRRMWHASYKVMLCLPASIAKNKNGKFYNLSSCMYLAFNSTGTGCNIQGELDQYHGCWCPGTCVTRGLFYQHGLTLIPAWISNHMPGKVWDEITYPFLNFNGCTVKV